MKILAARTTNTKGPICDSKLTPLRSGPGSRDEFLTFHSSLQNAPLRFLVALAACKVQHVNPKLTLSHSEFDLVVSKPHFHEFAFGQVSH